jgi:Fe-coproporphyrin III synthase
MRPGGQKADVLMLHLLGRCNLECAHCYMEGSPHRRETLDLDIVLQSVRECRSLGVGSISITGGEPLLYPNLDRVLACAAEQSDLKITLCTNGTLITDRRAARFGELGLRMNVSIDGRPDFHDEFRKVTGCFADAERGVGRAIKRGVPVTIISTVSRGNIGDVPFLVDWAAGAGAERFFVQPLLKLGRGKDISGQCLTFEEMNRLILQLSDLANRTKNRNLKCQIIGAKKKFLTEHPCGAFVRNGTRCHRGVAKEIRKLVIREDGVVLPEVPNLSRRFALGNVRDGSLSELIDRYFDSGYDEFDSLCRAAYDRILPDWDCVIVPWEQIVAQCSETWIPGTDTERLTHTGGNCGCSNYGCWSVPAQQKTTRTDLVAASPN